MVIPSDPSTLHARSPQNPHFSRFDIALAFRTGFSVLGSPIPSSGREGRPLDPECARLRVPEKLTSS